MCYISGILKTCLLLVISKPSLRLYKSGVVLVSGAVALSLLTVPYIRTRYCMPYCGYWSVVSLLSLSERLSHYLTSCHLLTDMRTLHTQSRVHAVPVRFFQFVELNHLIFMCGQTWLRWHRGCPSAAVEHSEPSRLNTPTQLTWCQTVNQLIDLIHAHGDDKALTISGACESRTVLFEPWAQLCDQFDACAIILIFRLAQLPRRWQLVQ